MNKVIPAFIYVTFILMLTGCQKKKINNVIYDTIGKKIEMDIHKNNPAQFTILRYIDNPTCTSCRKHSKKCTFYILRFGCSFAAVNTIKPQLL